METWGTVAIVIGSNIIIALATFFTTKYQVSHSDKRFSVELQIAEQRNIEAKQKEDRERRREVRSEPLLKLRNELANMAFKYNNCIAAIRVKKGGTDIDIENKDAISFSQQAIEELYNYALSGDFQRSLNIQYDKQLVDFIEEIRSDYELLSEYALEYRKLKPEELKEFRKIFLDIKTRIPEIQELINKKLEEL